MNPLDIIDKYYAHNAPLRDLLLVHSSLVASRALAVAHAHPELALDRSFLYEASMLHDIGIYLTNAPGIFCHGAEPYLRHGFLGACLMRREGLPMHARVCERHTGTGLTSATIESRRLPLPPGIYTPETLEEQVVCFADKFFSKSSPTRIKTADEAMRSIARFGDEGAHIFVDWLTRFG